jgi:hypothetical protein
MAQADSFAPPAGLSQFFSSQPHPRSAESAGLRWGFHEKAFNVKANVVAWRRLLRGPPGDAPHRNLLFGSFPRREMKHSLRRPDTAVRFARLPFALW